jgi:uncharacterized SAM-binding protein YcdF (DUF218 family)
MNHDCREMMRQEPCECTDAVIVLSNLMDQNGQLNAESSARASRAVGAYFECEAKCIVTCGWAYREDSHLTIADAFRRHILEGHPSLMDKVWVEAHSRDTVGDAYFTKVNLAVPRRWKKIVVVTSMYHVPRTSEIFRFVYGPEFRVAVLGAQVASTTDQEANESKSLEAFRATVRDVAAGDDKGILKRLRERHPFYNGDVHPRI